MRILATGDIHGNDAIYRQLPGLVAEFGATHVVLAGDLLRGVLLEPETMVAKWFDREA